MTYIILNPHLAVRPFTHDRSTSACKSCQPGYRIAGSLGALPRPEAVEFGNSTPRSPIRQPLCPARPAHQLCPTGPRCDRGNQFARSSFQCADHGNQDRGEEYNRSRNLTA